MTKEPAKAVSEMLAMQAENLNAWYGKKQALYDITLPIPALSVSALIGPSGCGKSTFLRCLNRMHEEILGTRISGTVSVEGADIYARSLKARYVRRTIGMVFQQPNVLPTLSIRENVAIGARLNGLISNKSSLEEKIEHSLRQAALWNEVKERLHTSALSLSGGQQQRLCIARALMLEPRILLMDEPCSALDPESTFKVEELIKELKQHYTVIIVTHNMQQAARVADVTTFFLQGKIIETGATKQIFRHPEKQETEAYISGRFS